jgi:magnesium chelatase family protein
MLASCLPGILPPLSPREALEVSMIHSLSGTLAEDGLMKARPYRDPHHSASLPALIGGGHKVKPGEVSLAHHGVLFLDELPEFSRATLEALRQPLETGQTLVARANHHATYPARFQLIAAMNPCRCGYLGDPDRECTKAPRCGQDYQTKLSGPLLDRIDIQVDVPAVSVSDLDKASGENSADVAARIIKAREMQHARFQNPQPESTTHIMVNAHAEGDVLESTMILSAPAKTLLNEAAEKMRLSARAYFRLIRVSRTIADLAGQEGDIQNNHVAEALAYRKISLN